MRFKIALFLYPSHCQLWVPWVPLSILWIEDWVAHRDGGSLRTVKVSWQAWQTHTAGHLSPELDPLKGTHTYSQPQVFQTGATDPNIKTPLNMEQTHRELGLTITPTSHVVSDGWRWRRCSTHLKGTTSHSHVRHRRTKKHTTSRVLFLSQPFNLGEKKTFHTKRKKINRSKTHKNRLFHKNFTIPH